MMKKLIVFFLCVVCFLSLHAQKKVAAYVDPFIGTGGHGHTYPGAVLPHGMVQLSPDTRLQGWDGCSGYHYDDQFIYGFTHTHLSGTGCSDYGDILLMPMNGSPSPDNKIYGSAFTHSSEKATPGFYSVMLNDDHILAELTTTLRVGFHKYSFSSSQNPTIILDLKHRDEVIESSLKIINNTTIAGVRRSKAWAKNQYVYFYIRFSEPFISKGIWEDEQLIANEIKQIDSAKNIKAFFSFDKKTVMAKVAISSVSIDGAKKNMDAELPGWNFEKIKSSAGETWNKELGKIIVESGDLHQMRSFYTALYHTMIVPNLNMDVDHQYRGRDNKIHLARNFTNYTVFSLWDTYRAAHPLYTIIDRKRTLDYIQTFLNQYQQGGRLPVWELSSCETDCMIGYHSVPVIVDAYLKGINQFDTKLALDAMKNSATYPHLGLPALQDHGFLQQDDEAESVSKTLEYAYDDWCIAQFAKHTGNKKDYPNYIKRAQAYKNILDIKTGFMRPRKNGNWLSPFDPKNVDNNFTEANSWQYSFYVPQDFSGYTNMMGGKEKVEAQLDSLFTQSSRTTGREQADITGLIGQYAHGNEPSHHIAYLYNFTGKAYKTQQRVHQILTTLYHDIADGLAGNEDCGQMSAWYVLSALGFYPVTPGTSQYVIGSPLFKKATIYLENNKQFTITANNVSNTDFYIQKATLNGSLTNKSFLDHAAIMHGGNISFTMGNKPAAFGNTNSPATGITDNLLVLSPVINGAGVTFRNTKQISIYSNQQNVAFYYSLDGSTPTAQSLRYTTPFNIDSSCTIRAIAVNQSGNKSFITTAKFLKVSNNYGITLNTLPYLLLPETDGINGLTDGIRGAVEWRKGNWQGYQQVPVSITVDLKEQKNISIISARFLQDVGSWIVMPRKVIFEVSADGNTFKEVYQTENILPVENPDTQIKNIEAHLQSKSARFVKITALQYGKLPGWHAGAGENSIIFIDEIEVK